MQVVHGDGIASYMNDGGTDLAPNAYFNPLSPTSPALSAEAVPLTGVVAYYDHYWNEKFSSSIGYSSTQVDNTNFQTAERLPQRPIRLGELTLDSGRQRHDGR